MSRAARRRAERAAAKGAAKNGRVEPEARAEPAQLIRLENPVTDLFEVFIAGNAAYVEQVVEPGSADGQTIVICGAGPSLADEADKYCREGFDQLWGANSAMPWLLEKGYPVTHAITVDQTPAMVNEWWTAPDVEYLVASTVHPHLVEHLLQKGRKLRWFHNYVGIRKPPVAYCACGHDHDPDDTDKCTDPECDCERYDLRVMAYEDWLYANLYPATIRAGSGLNTVTRAIDVAFIMGAAKVIVLGADCAIRVKRPLPRNVKHGSLAHQSWLENETTMHADGGNALASGATPITVGGEIDGRWWESKPDMMISAVYMLKMQEYFGPDRLIYVGDTLPNALRDAKSFRTRQGELITVNVREEFIARLPKMIDTNGNAIPIEITPPLLTDAEAAM